MTECAGTGGATTQKVLGPVLDLKQQAETRMWSGQLARQSGYMDISTKPVQRTTVPTIQ